MRRVEYSTVCLVCFYAYFLQSVTFIVYLFILFTKLFESTVDSKHVLCVGGCMEI